MKIKTVENNKLKKHSLDMIAIADRIEEATSESDFFSTISALEFVKWKMFQKLEREATEHINREKAKEYIN